MFSGRITNLKNKRDVSGLLNLYAQNADNVNVIHLANIYGILAKEVRGFNNVEKLKTDERFKGLLESTIDKLQSTPEWFDVRGIATITHSLGKLKIFDEGFFNEIVRLRERIAKEGEPQTLSNIVWAFATVGCESAELFEAVAAQHGRIAREGKVQELSNSCWAFAKAGHRADALFEAVAGQHKLIAERGNAQELSNTCWAFAKAGHRADALFEEVVGQHKRIVASDKVQAMITNCWAFATVGHEAEALFKAVAAQHGRFVGNGNEQEVTTTLWSFAIAGYLDEGSGLVKKLWKMACDGRLQLNKEGLLQLALFYAAAQIEGPKLDLEPLPESLLSQIEAAAAQLEDIVSLNHKEVSDTLKELEIYHEIEVSPFESSNVTFNTSTMLNIDIVISKNLNKNIAIEFNGPSHYIRFNGRDVENGTTKFKRRLLEKLNFTVVSIHWDDWRKAREANTRQVFLLAQIPNWSWSLKGFQASSFFGKVKE